MSIDVFLHITGCDYYPECNGHFLDKSLNFFNSVHHLIRRI